MTCFSFHFFSNFCRHSYDSGINVRKVWPLNCKIDRIDFHKLKPPSVQQLVFHLIPPGGWNGVEYIWWRIALLTKLQWLSMGLTRKFRVLIEIHLHTSDSVCFEHLMIFKWKKLFIIFTNDMHITAYFIFLTVYYEALKFGIHNFYTFFPTKMLSSQKCFNLITHTQYFSMADSNIILLFNINLEWFTLPFLQTYSFLGMFTLSFEDDGKLT